MSRIIISLEDEASSGALCACASWIATALGSPLQLVRILSENADDSEREQARQLLTQCEQQLRMTTSVQLHAHQLYGDSADILSELGRQARLLVCDRRGILHGLSLRSLLGAIRIPLLSVPERFQPPQSLLLAYDGGEVSRRCVDLLASSDLLDELALHILWVASDTSERRQELAWIEERMASTGREARLNIRPGEVEETLQGYINEHTIDMLMMGAYGQSRLREILFGSTTDHMLRTAHIPLFLMP